MACPLFDTIGEHGEDLLASEVVEAELSQSGRTSKSGRPKSACEKPKGGTRAKKNEVVMLSTSFTCWRKCPESRFRLSLLDSPS